MGQLSLKPEAVLFHFEIFWWLKKRHFIVQVYTRRALFQGLWVTLWHCAKWEQTLASVRFCDQGISVQYLLSGRHYQARLVKIVGLKRETNDVCNSIRTFPIKLCHRATHQCQYRELYVPYIILINLVLWQTSVDIRVKFYVTSSSFCLGCLHF